MKILKEQSIYPLILAKGDTLQISHNNTEVFNQIFDKEYKVNHITTYEDDVLGMTDVFCIALGDKIE